MNNKDNIDKNLELAKTIHWRYFKSLVKTFAAIEDINLNSYNLNTIKCYSCNGYDLQGKDVKYKTFKRFFLLGSK